MAPELLSLAAGTAEALLRAVQAARAPAASTEDLHRLRVAARRLRALLSLSREAIPEPEWRPLQEALRGLLRATGPARDWQVLLAATLPALLAQEAASAEAAAAAAAGQRLLAEARQREAAARRHSVRALSGRGHLQLLLALERYLLACAAAAAEGGKLSACVAPVLSRQHRRLRRRARRLDRDDPEALHRLRLRLKAQRYRVELLAPDYPGKAAARYLARLKRLQEQIGRQRDLQLAEQRLRSLRPATAEARALRGRLAQGCARRAAECLAGIKGLRLHGDGFRPFWDY